MDWRKAARVSSAKKSTPTVHASVMTKLVNTLRDPLAVYSEVGTNIAATTKLTAIRFAMICAV